MTHEPLGRIPKNRKKKETITISVDEYTHLKQCESFIDDNGHFWTFEAYKDVVNHMEEVENLGNEEVERNNGVIEQSPEDPTRV